MIADAKPATSELTVARLEKRYKARTVVHDVSLDVAEGIRRARVAEAAARKVDARVTNSDGASFGRSVGAAGQPYRFIFSSPPSPCAGSRSRTRPTVRA